MHITHEQLRAAGNRAGLTEEQIETVWSGLGTPGAHTRSPKFDGVHVAYYLGALIVIGAMGWFMTKAWEGLGGAGLFAVSVCYAICFLLGGRTLWRDAETRTPGGLLITMAVCMAPLATYGVERWTGYWPSTDPGTYTNFHPYINSSWVIMEVVTIVCGLVALRIWRFPFLTAPIAYSLWYLSMDGIALLGGMHDMSWQEKKIISVVFGAMMILASYLADLRSKAADFAFWGYLFGVATFWGGLTAMDSNSELGKFCYALTNLALIVCAVLLKRRVFIVFGALGFFGYLGHLAYRVFADSVLFPVVLTVLGLSIIYVGVKYQRHRAAIDDRFRAVLLPHIRRLIPARALE